jgi:tripartite-type tricarboxylate transporter receptor subunit TctC
MKRSVFVASALAALLLPFAASAQTDWPQKPVSLVVPYPPGGVNDAVARVYAEKLSAELGKPFIAPARPPPWPPTSSPRPRPTATRSMLPARR